MACPPPSSSPLHTLHPWQFCLQPKRGQLPAPPDSWLGQKKGKGKFPRTAARHSLQGKDEAAQSEDSEPFPSLFPLPAPSKGIPTHTPTPLPTWPTFGAATAPPQLSRFWRRRASCLPAGRACPAFAPGPFLSASPSLRRRSSATDAPAGRAPPRLFRLALAQTKGLQGEAAAPGNADRRALGTAVPAPSAALLQVPGRPRGRRREARPLLGRRPARLRPAAHGQPRRSREPRFASLGHSPRQQSRLRRRRCRCRSGALSHSEPPSSIARL